MKPREMVAGFEATRRYWPRCDLRLLSYLRVSASPRLRVSRAPRAFTLVEMLVVMGIIVLSITLAIPAIRMLTGSRSQEAATNTLGSYMGFARNEAIGLQEYRGVLFVLDDDGRVKCAEVRGTPSDPQLARAVEVPELQTSSGTLYLDLVPDRDMLSLSAGVRLWTLNDSKPPVGKKARYPAWRYLGMNPPTDFAAPAPYRNVRIGGVILFGPDGRLVGRQYGFRFMSGGQLTALGQWLVTPDTKKINTQIWPAVGASDTVLLSQIGCAMFDGQEFRVAVGNDTAEGNGDTQEQTADAWIDTNATPIFVNRYSGSLMRAE